MYFGTKRFTRDSEGEKKMQKCCNELVSKNYKCIHLIKPKTFSMLVFQHIKHFRHYPVAEDGMKLKFVITTKNKDKGLFEIEEY